MHNSKDTFMFCTPIEQLFSGILKCVALSLCNYKGESSENWIVHTKNLSSLHYSRDNLVKHVCEFHSF